MRIIGVFERQDQVGGLIDSLKKVGLDRKDMVVSDMVKTKYRKSGLDNVYIKTETDSLQNLDTLGDTLKDKIGTGIVVSVETSKHKTSMIREIMEQNGANNIIQD